MTLRQVILDQKPYFEKYMRTSTLPAHFCTNTVKYGWVGRSAKKSKTEVMVLHHKVAPHVAHIYKHNWLHNSRVPDQNSVSQAWFTVEIHHSGQEPSIYPCSPIGFSNANTNLQKLAKGQLPKGKKRPCPHFCYIWLTDRQLNTANPVIDHHKRMILTRDKWLGWASKKERDKQKD